MKKSISRFDKSLFKYVSVAPAIEGAGQCVYIYINTKSQLILGQEIFIESFLPLTQENESIINMIYPLVDICLLKKQLAIWDSYYGALDDRYYSIGSELEIR